MSSPALPEVNEAERATTPSRSSASRRSLSSRAASTSRPASSTRAVTSSSRPLRAASGAASPMSASRLPSPSCATMIERCRPGSAAAAARLPTGAQRRVVLQDRALQLLQARARVEPELVGQRAPRLSQDVECLDVPAAR